jgi:hypothetical protein
VCEVLVVRTHGLRPCTSISRLCTDQLGTQARFRPWISMDLLAQVVRQQLPPCVYLVRRRCGAYVMPCTVMGHTRFFLSYFFRYDD